MFEIINNGLFKEVSSPIYGKQDIGIAPGGPMDRLSFEVGNALLGNFADSPALEMVISPKLKFKRDCYFVLTGAAYKKVTYKEDRENGEDVNIAHGTVSFAPAGSVLKFGRKLYGVRTYLCYTDAKNMNKRFSGNAWDEFEKSCDCAIHDREIRVVEGPEYRHLDDSEHFLKTQWITTNDLNEMGMRLGCEGDYPTVSMNNMISGPVSDGTIQLTPNGPIVLLRHRQTVGGYPRIFNVISADMDLLGQYSAKKSIRFKKISIDEAVELAKTRRSALEELKKRLNGVQ
ncbi:hypothetical protein KKA14_03285 [bacterium]|nr:hypothetical protein [bacterium]